MLHLRRTDAKGQRAQRAVGGGMAVAANDGRAGQRQAQLRPDDVHDALTDIHDGNVGDAEFGDVLLQGLHLDAAVFFLDVSGNARSDGGDVVVGHRDRQVRAAQLAAGQAQAFERLRAGHLMQQMPVDIKDAGAIRQSLDDVAVPYLVEKGAWPACGHVGSQGYAVSSFVRSG